ncbi:MAG: hypothetical protein ACJAZ2_000243 [Glaciecola sp.]|jgi:hypothetical protein
MKKIVLFTTLLIAVNFIFAQDAKSDTTAGNHFVGLSIGSTTGMGFSYKYVKNRFGIQLTGIPVFSDSELWASAGVGFTFRSKKAVELNKKFVPLLYAGSSIMVDNRSLDFLSIGAGFGFDHKFSENFVFSFMGGYGFYAASSLLTTFSGEMGLHYKM